MSQARLYVELIAHTPAPEAVIATAARLCYSGDDLAAHRQKTAEGDSALFLRRLMDFGHLSPVEHASFTFAVQGVSRALLAQLTRHRIASFSVQSQRYVSQEGFSYVLPPAVAMLGNEAVKKFEEQMRTIGQWYEQWQSALGRGEKGNEDARFVLPNACETRLIMTMNARELAHFFALRCCGRAQWEIRAMAWAVLGHCLGAAPSLFAAAGPSCMAACSEGKMSCGQAERVRRMQKELSSFVEANRGEPDFAALISDWASRHITDWME